MKILRINICVEENTFTHGRRKKSIQSKAAAKNGSIVRRTNFLPILPDYFVIFFQKFQQFFAEYTPRALEKIHFLEKIGFTQFCLTPTYYNIPNFDHEYYDHFVSCKTATSMNMIIYNIPSCTSFFIPVDVIRQCAEEQLMIAIKESSGNKDYYLKLAAIAEKHNIELFQANEPDFFWAVEHGTDGFVPVLGNYDPALYVKLCEAVLQNNLTGVKDIQAVIDTMREIILLGNKKWLAGIMYAVHTLGIGNGIPLLPTHEPPEEEKQKIKKYTTYKNISC